MIETVREGIVHMLHTRDGARVGMICLWHGSAKVCASMPFKNLPYIVSTPTRNNIMCVVPLPVAASLLSRCACYFIYFHIHDILGLFTDIIR